MARSLRLAEPAIGGAAPAAGRMHQRAAGHPSLATVACPLGAQIRVATIRPASQDRSVATIPDTAERRLLRERMFDPLSQRILVGIGVADRWRCLDAGAGRGSIAAWLARQVEPTGHVVAVDMDTELLHTVRDVSFERFRHDLTTDGPVGRDFDLVHCRFVLEHLPERERVLDELIDQLRPGGWIVVQDADFSPTALADSKPYARAMAAFDAAMAARGTDYAWTRQLPARLAARQLAELEATAETTWFPSGSDHARFWASNLVVMRDRMIDTGLMDERAHGQVIDELLHGGQWLPGIAVLAARGRRPS